MARSTSIGAVVALLVMAFVAGPLTPVPAQTSVKQLVVYSPYGLPADTGRELEKIDGVSATPVILGLDWLMRSYKRDGSKVDSPPTGYGYPFEVAVIKPAGYRRFVPEGDRGLIDGLEPGEALISRTEARLRTEGDGLRLGLRSGRLKVMGVVPDRVTQGYEALTPAPVPRGWTHKMRFFLVEAPTTVSKDRLKRAVREAAGDILFEIKSDAQVNHLRYAPSVKPQATFKRAFGEFPARPASTGSLSMYPGWVDRHIKTDSVPILGRVTCHRKLFPQMRGALRELRNKGLGHLIRTDEYAGCYNARFVATPAGVRLSRHSWGIAFDINTSNNQFGAEPHQDARLVKIMERWGFLWGGRWALPDGMHFEWDRFPS